MVKVISSEFEDIFGNVLTYYQNDACDKMLCRYGIEISIETESSNTQLITVGTSPNTLGLFSGTWLNFGFRVGDAITLTVYNSSGGVVSSTASTISNIFGNLIQVTFLPPSAVNGTMYDSNTRLKITANATYDEIDIYSNHVPNGTVGSSESLIDGENTVIRFENVASQPLATPLNGANLGKTSGQFDTFGNLIYTAVDGNTRFYTIEVETHQSGILDQTQFLGSSCLKHYIKVQCKRNSGETFGISEAVYSLDANTGLLDEAFNLGIVDAELQGVSILSINGGVNYDEATNILFTVQTTSTEFQIGALYIPLEDNYNHNKYYSQSELCMLSESFTPFTGGVALYPSRTNPTGANYTLTLDVNTVINPTTKEYQVILNPNTAFTNFMESLPDGDRRFVIYFKAGNVNLTIFDGQLTQEEKVWGDLDLAGDVQFLRHDENQNTPVTDNWLVGDYTTIIEDDLGYLLNFIFNKSIFYKEVRVFIEAYNTSTGERFDLERASFDLSTTPVVSGKQLINLSLGVSNNLPNTSAKKQALLINDTTVTETVSEYGVRLYYPFLVRWEYWLNQIGVNADFYPYKGKKWREYTLPANWQVQITTQAITSNDKIFSYSKSFDIRDYEDSPFINRTRKLLMLDGTEVSAFIDGEILEIQYEWECITPLDGIDMYGTICVESTESQPRWLISTTVQHDFNTFNPLQPISGNLATVTLVSSNKVRVSCYIDCNKLDLSKDVDLSARIALNPASTSNFILLEDGFRLLQEDNNKLLIE